MAKTKRDKKSDAALEAGTRHARADERQACIRAAEAVLHRHEAMGFRHNAERALGAREVLTALLRGAEATPYQVAHVAGLTPVTDTSEW